MATFLKWMSDRLFKSLLFILVCTFVQSCRTDSGEHSELFTRVFTDRGGDFRGVDIGMPIDQVKTIEGKNPRHDDEFGLVYEFNLITNQDSSATLLQNERFLIVEYYKGRPASAREDEVMGIIANIGLKDEVEANELYQEIETWFNSKYGIPENNYGNFMWDDEERRLLIYLKLNPGKNTITLNYTRNNNI